MFPPRVKQVHLYPSSYLRHHVSPLSIRIALFVNGHILHVGMHAHAFMHVSGGLAARDHHEVQWKVFTFLGPF